jgi:hypothetical protein
VFFRVGHGTIDTLFGFTDNLFANMWLDAEWRGRHLAQHVECVVQGEVLSFGHDTQKTASMKPVKKGSEEDRQMGSALRSVYQKTVDEAVPDEMLALLGKLD